MDSNIKVLIMDHGIKRIEGSSLFSEAVITNNLIFISGQVAFGSSIKEQTVTILKKIDKILDSAKTNNQNILMANIWLANIEQYDDMNELWNSWIPHDSLPARTCTGAKLAKAELLIEISVIAKLI